MKVQRYYPHALMVDGEVIVLRITRMDLDQWYAFDEAFTAAGTPTIQRFVARAPEQQAQDAEGEYLVPFAELARHRLDAMTPEERAAYSEAQEKDEADARAFLTDTFERYVTVDSGLTEEQEDGSEQAVIAGADLLRIFGARKDVLGAVLAAVRRENTLGADQKKALRSPSDSPPSSTAPDPAAAGPRPATTAAPVATEASAPIADATATPADPSGSMAPSSSPAVPSST